MRSLKECYEIAKRFHYYWVGGNNTQYMCIAAKMAQLHGKLTEEESDAVQEDAMSLVHALDSNAGSLAFALRGGNTVHENVKVFWEMYIDNLENQDG